MIQSTYKCHSQKVAASATLSPFVVATHISFTSEIHLQWVVCFSELKSC